MSCGFSREILALDVEGDLPDEVAATTASHLASCEECRQFVDELHASQALLKSVRRDAVSPAACAAMRREVMTLITGRPQALGWGVRIERAITLGLRPSFGMAALLLLGILSVSMLAQMRPVTTAGVLSADTLLRPEGYRGWILVSGVGPVSLPDTGSTAADRVYINPSSYREYSKTGRFPDGTVLVWEPASPQQPRAGGGPHGTSSTFLVSVKDSAKFEGGWGFYDFSGARTARALPESSGCRTCHRQSAANDHVFTRFSPGLLSLHVGGSRAILTLYPFDGTPYDTSIYQGRRNRGSARGRLLGPDVVESA